MEIIYGLHSIFQNISITFSSVVHHPLMWGVGLGFLISTAIHAFVVAENPRQFSTIMLQESTSAFTKLSPRLADGTYCFTFSEFQKQYNKVRVAFYSAVMGLLIAITAAVIKF